MTTFKPAVEGAYVLDLFAGSGALGIEALSRGAAHVTFVDFGKVPLGVDNVVARAPGRTTLRTFRGEDVEYVDPSEAEARLPNGPALGY